MATGLVNAVVSGNLSAGSLSGPLPWSSLTGVPAGFADGNGVSAGRSGLFRRADAFVIVTAEYNHSIPPALSNTLDHFLEEYFWRPSAIVCYSAGAFGGTTRRNASVWEPATGTARAGFSVAVAVPSSATAYRPGSGTVKRRS